MKYYAHQVNIQLDILNLCPPGPVFEFGVYMGQSLRLFNHSDPSRKLVGFDSFDGLPEDWRTGFSKGTFATTERIDLPGIELVEGLFENTVKDYFRNYTGEVGLFHVDCDLYSSSKTVLDGIQHLLKPGVVVLFDEFRNYPDSEKHQYRAWQEAVTQYSISAEEIARSGHQQSAWRIR